MGLDCVTNQMFSSFCEESMKLSQMLFEYILKHIGYGATKISRFFQGIRRVLKMVAKMGKITKNDISHKLHWPTQNW